MPLALQSRWRGPPGAEGTSLASPSLTNGRSRPAMSTATSINREWIVSEFSKGIEAERSLQMDEESTASSPPDPSLGLLYHEIATADGRHAEIVEIIATRYGYNPGRGMTTGLGGTLGRMKERMGELGCSPQQRLEHDLSAKASAIHWCTAWVYTFQTIRDAASARELAAVLTEEKAHHDALQEGLNRLVAKGAVEGN